MKELSVILKRDPLVELRCKDLLKSVHNQRRPRLRKVNTGHHCKDLNLRSKVSKQSQKHLNENEKIKEFTNDKAKEKLVNKADNTKVVLKSCIGQKNNNNETKRGNENVALEDDMHCHDNTSSTKQAPLQKLPVYQQTNERSFTRNSDLYEFNEPDFDNSEVAANNKRKIKKQKPKSNRRKPQINKIGRKGKISKTRNNYEAKIQEIINNIVKKIQLPEFGNKTPIPVPKEVLPKSNVNSVNVTNVANKIKPPDIENTSVPTPKRVLRQRNVNNEVEARCKEQTINHKKDNYEAIIQDIVKNVAEKIKPPDLQNKTPISTLSIHNNYEVIIRDIVRNVSETFVLAKFENKTSTPTPKQNVNNEIEQIPKEKSCSNYETINQEIFRNVATEILPPNFENRSSTPIYDEVPPEYDVNEEIVNLHLDCDVSYNSDNEVGENMNLSTTEDEVCDDPNTPDNFFGFDSPERTNKKIHVIQDIILDENTSFSVFDTEFVPATNNDKFAPKKCNPWRFTENLTRNPHYLIIKNTALPCLKQDMIIDYNLLKKLRAYVPKTTKTVKNKKTKTKPSPKKLKDLRDAYKENISQSNLFENDFNNHLKVSQDVSPKKPKRTVLGLLQQNFINNKSGTNRSPNNRIVNVESQRAKTPIAKIAENSEIQELDQDLDKSAFPLDNLENGHLTPKLFEDEEPETSVNLSNNIKIYKPKKRKRLAFENVEDAAHHHRAKKDIMTKAEEAKLEQWAAKFNSMCEDIEKYDLEVE